MAMHSENLRISFLNNSSPYQTAQPSRLFIVHNVQTLPLKAKAYRGQLDSDKAVR